jgi:hypothetical protein
MRTRHPSSRRAGIGIGLVLMVVFGCVPPSTADLIVGLSPAGTRVPFAPRLVVQVCLPQTGFLFRGVDCDVGGEVRVGDSVGVAGPAGFEVGTASLDLETLEPLTVQVSLGDVTGFVQVDAPFGPRALLGPASPLETGSELTFTWSHAPDTLGAPETERIANRGIETTVRRADGGTADNTDGGWPVRLDGDTLTVTVPTTAELAGSCPELSACAFQIDMPVQVRVLRCDFGACAMEELYRVFSDGLVDEVPDEVTGGGADGG